jgi:glycosyltransferase involved in cell wall biosynthesis
MFSLKMLYRQDFEHIDKYWLIHSVSVGLPALIAGQWCKQYRLPHVTQLIGFDVDIMMPFMKKMPGIKLWDKSVVGVVANSRYLAEKFIKYYPNTDNIRVIYRGVDLKRFNPSIAVNESYKLSKGVSFLYLGGVGYSETEHTGYMKGGNTIIDAWKKYEKDLLKLDASLLLAGPNTPNQQLISWRDSLGYPDRVRFLGLVHPNDMPRLMCSVDAILIPSLREGLPNVGMEAFGCGKPILGSQVGGIPELVRDGLDGRLAPPGDVDAWGLLLVESAANREELIRLGISARHRVQQFFDSICYGKHLYEFYEEAVESLPKA